MSKITIPRDEHGKVRVFTLSLSDPDIEELQDGGLEQALGTDILDPNQVEIFRVDDLGAMGLTGYLRAGIDADEAEITEDATGLEAVDGWVMLVHSAAFGGAEAKLEPKAGLTLVGTYALAQADHTNIPLESDAAAPYTGVPNLSPPIPPKGRAGGSLVVVGLVVLAAIILWWAFS